MSCLPILIHTFLCSSSKDRFTHSPQDRFMAKKASSCAMVLAMEGGPGMPALPLR